MIFLAICFSFATNGNPMGTLKDTIAWFGFRTLRTDVRLLFDATSTR
jgi:hypothetical protein